MKIEKHADNTEKLYNLRAEDIHKWIDGYFERDTFDLFLQYGKIKGFNPYDHRKFRHCKEALPDVIKEFSHKYSKTEIKHVFESHIRDDYNNYIPSREDFTNGTFSEKYHFSEVKSDPILTKDELNRYFKGLYYKNKNNQSSGRRWFKLRIVLPAAISVILFFVSIFNIIIPEFNKSLLTEKEEMLKEIAGVATSIAGYYISLEQNGTLSRVEAQTSVLEELQKIRYGNKGDNYFWITDKTPIMLMHPWRPDLIGEDLSDFRDNLNKSGKKLFVESVELVNSSGGGFLHYLWQLPGNKNRVVPKLSYVQGVENWAWIIGTGIYIHDVEDEIDRLTIHLVKVLVYISILMVLVLLWMVYQSSKIELNRQQAESGLIEAKERYQALVEASNEGYILKLEKEIVFCNPTFERMTGYSIEELNIDNPISVLIDEHKDNDQFEIAIECKNRTLLDVVITISKIFLSNENGKVITFRPLTNQITTPILNKTPDVEAILGSLLKAKNSSQVINILNQLPIVIRQLMHNSPKPDQIRTIINRFYKTSIKQIIDLSTKELGEPPSEFSFLSLGSAGRDELTLFSDQDNAILFSFDPSMGDIEKVRLYYLKIADRICTCLNKGGFAYCDGGIMGVNPSWCLTLDEWKKQYSNWIIKQDSDSLLELNVFFDISLTWGSDILLNELKQHIFKAISKSPEFFNNFANNALKYRTNTNFLGLLKSDKRDGFSVINIKESLVILNNFVRLYALNNSIFYASTLKRVEELSVRDIFTRDTTREIIFCFENLWEMRLTNQLFRHSELRKVNDDLDISALSAIERKKLNRVISSISDLQSKLSFDFLGIDIT